MRTVRIRASQSLTAGSTRPGPSVDLERVQGRAEVWSFDKCLYVLGRHRMVHCEAGRCAVAFAGIAPACYQCGRDTFFV
jgi:hypothetical protein